MSHSASVDLTIMVMLKAKRMTEMVQPVIIPFSSQCQSDVLNQEVTLKPNLCFISYKQ